MDTKRSKPSAVVATILAALATIPFSDGISLGQSAGAVVEAQEGILLLRNGEALRGRITRLGDRYSVGMDGGQVSVRAVDAEMVCRSLDEAYHQKRYRVPLDNVAEKLELAQWCQRQGMFGAAAQELSEAMAIDPNHPMISVVERRLRLAVEQSQKVEQAQVQTEPPPSAKELDRLVRGMPPGSVEAFTQTIQPLLMNNCTLSGCHGAGSNHGISLLRAPTGRTPSRRLTQRNLLATLEWINRSDPAKSPLLTSPTRPHGTARTPIFTSRQLSQYQELVDWVYRVAQVPSPVDSISRYREPVRRPSHVTPAAHNEPLATESLAPFSGIFAPTAPQRPNLNREGGPASDARTGNADQMPARPDVKRAQPIPSSVPEDALDPERFNSQFAPSPRPAVNDPPPDGRR